MLKVNQNILIVKHSCTKQYSVLVKYDEFIRLEMDEVKCILNDTNQDCRNDYFHSFEYRCVYDILFINTENNEGVISTVIIGFMKFKSQLHGLKNQNCVEKWILI